MGEYHLGLIGWPLKRSLSPRIHQAALKSLELEGDYVCFPVEPLPKGEEALRKLLSRMRRGEVQGLNVTLPHKEIILRELDRLTPAAESIGAVNTIFVKGSELVGDNTDKEGFLVDLDAALAPVPGHALILGAGGAARAVVYGLHERGWEVWVAARRIVQAEGLAESLSQSGGPSILPIKLDAEALRSVGAQIQLVVNATSVGMTPDVEASPWPKGVPFPDQADVYDLVYWPRETRLMREAHRIGLKSASGLGMLVEQAALSFERWTGRLAPREAMRQAAERWEQGEGR